MDQTGRANILATITKPTSTDDAYGGKTDPTWSTHAQAWIEVLTPKGRAFYLGEAAQDAVQTALKARYRTDVTTEMRVTFKGITYAIKATAPTPDYQFLILDCEQVRGE